MSQAFLPSSPLIQKTQRPAGIMSREADSEEVWIPAGQTGEGDAGRTGAGGGFVAGVGGGINLLRNKWVKSRFGFAKPLKGKCFNCGPGIRQELSSIFSAVITGIVTFAATNVDDLFILMFFFSQIDASFPATAYRGRPISRLCRSRRDQPAWLLRKFYFADRLDRSARFASDCHGSQKAPLSQ